MEGLVESQENGQKKFKRKIRRKSRERSEEIQREGHSSIVVVSERKRGARTGFLER